MSESTASIKTRSGAGGVWNGDIEWLLTQAQAALGQRGTMGAVESILERGGPSAGSVPTSELCDDEQLGWGRHKNRSTIVRYRRLEGFWRALARDHQASLIVYYCPAGLPEAVRKELGALAVAAYMLSPTAETGPLEAACERLHQNPYDYRRTAAGKTDKARLDTALARVMAPITVAHSAWELIASTQKRDQERASLVEQAGLRVTARAQRAAAVAEFVRLELDS